VIEGGQRVAGATSLVDVTATILDAGGAELDHVAAMQLDGDSLLPLMQGDPGEWKDEAFSEHLAHGTDRARAMIRRGRWKLCYSHGTPPDIELYDLESDQGEFDNLADHAEHRAIRAELVARVMEIWSDPDRLTEEIVASQQSRKMIREVLGDSPIF
jgi:arylsulfatase A-like enzyme